MRTLLLATLVVLAAVSPSAAQQSGKGAKPGAGKRPFGKSYYHLDLPTDFTPARKYSLVVMLHGSGGRPENYLACYKAALAKNCLVCLPASNNPAQYDDADEKQVLGMVDEVVKEYPIDRDRVLVSGHSAGAAISFFLVASRPDLFTACAPGAAGLRFPAEQLKPAAHVPFFIVTGARDFNLAECERSVEPLRKIGCEVKYESGEAWDHSLAPEAWAKMFAWFDSLLPPDQAAALQAARAQLDKKAWGKAAGAISKLRAAKTATDQARRRIARIDAAIEAAADAELAEARRLDDEGLTRKAVDLLGKARSTFDGAAAKERLDAALAEYRKKVEGAK